MKLKAKGLAAAGMAITLFLSPGAWAGESSNDELSVQPLVVTTTMTEKSIKEAPGSVEVITRQNIEDMNAQTLADAVENAVGLVVTTATGRNKRPNIRGTGDKHTLILIDGRRIAPGFKSYTGMEQIPVDIIDHIEVVRGPASALYGSDAMGGVINVITRKTPDKFTLEATGQLGQSTYAEGELGVGHALVGGSSGDLGFLLSGSYRHKDGYDRDNATPDDCDDSSLGSVAGRISYDISKSHHLLTGFEYMEKNAQGLRGLQKMDRERETDDDRLNLFLEYNGKISPVSNLMLRANHSTHEADVKIDPPTSMAPGVIGDESTKRRLDQLEGRFTSLFFDRHMVTIGAEGREEERKDDSGLANDITNLSFLDAENKDTGESLENRPDISSFVKLGYSNPDLGIRTSFRLPISVNASLTPEMKQPLPGQILEFPKNSPGRWNVSPGWTILPMPMWTMAWSPCLFMPD